MSVEFLKPLRSVESIHVALFCLLHAPGFVSLLRSHHPLVADVP